MYEAVNFESVAGQGVKAQVNEWNVAVGSKRFMESLNIPNLDSATMFENLQQASNSVVYVAIGSELAAAIELEETIRVDSPAAVSQLQKRGVNVIMATGDRQAAAKSIANKCGITEVHSELSPLDKLDLVKSLQTDGKLVAMAGDGINDAPALAQADVGIAMGGGADVAMECAGMTILSEDLNAIVRAHSIARATMTNVRQNLFFAFCYNAVGVPIAAGVLYPAFGILLSPIFAAAAMSLSSVSVIGNALRLRSFRP